jgi:hypothetical protein
MMRISRTGLIVVLTVIILGFSVQNGTAAETGREFLDLKIKYEKLNKDYGKLKIEYDKMKKQLESCGDGGKEKEKKVPRGAPKGC